MVWKIVGILIFSLTLYADFEKFDSLNSKFRQTITNEVGKKIIYEGELYLKKPYFALWEYREPVLKQVYLNRDEVIIIEPELEQVILTRVKSQIDFISILKNSKEISKDIREAFVEEQRYVIYLKDDKLERVQFIDKMENRVDILFFEQKLNPKISESFFTPRIPKEFDILRED